MVDTIIIIGLMLLGMIAGIAIIKRKGCCNCENDCPCCRKRDKK